MKQFMLLLALSLGLMVGRAQEKTTDVTVDAILEAYFENTGGADAWRSIKSMRVEGKMSQMGMEFNAVILSATPNLQRIDIDVQGQKIVQAYDGESGWMINPMMGSAEPQPMPAEQAEEMSEQMIESELLDYEEKGHTVELLGTQEVDGVECYEVKLTKANGKEEFYYFEPENMVPIMQKSISSAGPMKGQAVETYLSNYEEVDGIYMPFSMESRMGGNMGFTITVTKAELNPELAEDAFSMPAAEDK